MPKRTKPPRITIPTLRKPAGAVFSEDRIHRYVLWRTWDRKLPILLFVCLNPSTATETVDDPTVRRCIGYAKRWGFGTLIVCNAFALRSTDPGQLYQHDDPIGPHNDSWIDAMIHEAHACVVAWGNHGRFMGRGDALAYLFPETPDCLGVTKANQPKHPLYLPNDAARQPYYWSA